MRVSFGRYWSLMFVYLRPQRRRVFVLSALLAGSIAIQLLNPQLLRTFIDDATGGGVQEHLVLLTAAFVTAGLVGHTLTLAATWLSQNIGWSATNALRSDLFAHCLSLDMSFHKGRTPGEMIERMDGDVTALSLFFSQLAIQVAANSIIMAGVLVLLFLEDVRIGAAMLAFIVASFMVMSLVRRLGIGAWAAEREAGAQFYGTIGEVLTAREDLRANGARHYAMARFDDANRDYFGARKRANIASASIWTTSIGMFAVATAVAAAICAWLWNRGELTLGGIYIIFYYTDLIRQPLEQIRQQLQELQSAGASIGRIEELLRTPSRLEDAATGSLPTGALPLEFAAVSFGYEEDEAVIQDVSFRLEAGRCLGIVGRTGSGKTTLGRLVFRLYDPDTGEVRVGDVNIRDLPLSELRARVGVVSQDVQVFEGSVRDNLTFFDESMADERLLAALNEMGLSGWLDALPAGLDTEIRSGSLSAGEAQLLAFTRVLLKDPSIIILDEASSRLDPATERLVYQGLGRLLEGRTSILIAHRLRTLDVADEVLILEAGRVVERGARLSLANDANSRYAELLRTGLVEVLA